MVAGDLHQLAVAQHPGGRGVEQGELVERALGRELLHDPDRHIGDDEEAEQRVRPRTEDHEQSEAAERDRVEQREQVGAEDRAERAAGPLVEVVREPRGDACLHLGGRQAGGGQARVIHLGKIAAGRVHVSG